MARQLVLMAAAFILLAAASPMPATLGPPMTGSMYDGNNAHPPRLEPAAQPGAAAPASSANGGQGATGANVQGGRGAAQGGGG